MLVLTSALLIHFRAECLFGLAPPVMGRSLRQIGRAVLPARSGEYLRGKRRAWIFSRAMREYVEDPVGSWQRNPGLISELIYGWDNEGFTAREEYLRACLRHALVHRGSILECGSGLTTVLIGATLERNGGTMCSLEHDAAWRERTQAVLDRFRIRSVQLWHAPLKSHGDFFWYDVPSASPPTTISLMICDGPPADTPGGRYGAIPLMRHRLLRGAVVLLDDIEREAEQEIARRWADELGSSMEICGDEKRYARIAV